MDETELRAAAAAAAQQAATAIDTVDRLTEKVETQRRHVADAEAALAEAQERGPEYGPLGDDSDSEEAAAAFEAAKAAAADEAARLAGKVDKARGHLAAAEAALEEAKTAQELAVDDLNAMDANVAALPPASTDPAASANANDATIATSTDEEEGN